MTENTTLATAVEEFYIDRESRCSPETTKTYRSILGKFSDWFGGSKPLDEIDRQVLRRYIKHIKDRGLADTSREAHGKTIGAFLRFCFSEEFCKPFDLNNRLFPRAQVPETAVPPTDDVMAFLGAVNGNLRDKTILLVMIDSAIRRKETCDLTWGDINLELPRMMVMGKNQKKEPGYFAEATTSVLAEYRKQSGDPHDEEPVFVARGGGPLTPAGLYALFKRLNERASAETGRTIWITPHQLRRYALTELVRNGMDAFTLMRIARHRRIETTLRYVRLVDDDILAAHGRASPVAGLLNGNGRRSTESN